jgi:uncharacterized protein YqjF (DUF2071 family)
MTDPGRFLTAQWRHLAMLNYAVDPDLLTPHLPAGVELDVWHGAHYVSVVGFMFLHTRVLGVPIPFHRNFPEVNLRFYVRRPGRPDEPHVDADGYKRGVVFIKELVPRFAIAFVARTVYGEAYQSLPMRHTLALETAPDGRVHGSVAYEWRLHKQWQGLELAIDGHPAALVSGSEAAFITEHYWGYAAGSGRTLEYRVEHPPWRVWTATRAALHGDLAALYGDAFAAALAGPPRSAFLAEGSEIAVHRGRPPT